MFRLFKWRKSIKRFAKERKGAAAVEFALVAVPFFMLTFGLVEVLLIGFAQTSLDFAVSNAARQIRTGEAQLNGTSYGQIQDRLCNEVNRFVVLNCAGNLFLDVQRFDSFQAIDPDATPIEDGEFQDDGFGYAPGAPSDIVVVRAFYRWEVMTPLFERILGNLSSGERILVSTMMFRNEPYCSADC